MDNENSKEMEQTDSKSYEKAFYVSDKDGAIQIGSNVADSVRINFNGDMTDVVTGGDYTNVPYYKIITSNNISSQTVLNADTVDGKHAGEFVLKSGDTVTGSLKVNGTPVSETDVIRKKELDNGLNMKSDITHIHTAESIGADTPKSVNDKIANHNKDVNVHKGILETLEGSQDKANKAFEDSKEWARGVFSNPNLLINGDFQVWQRGNKLEGTWCKDVYLADRWFCFANAVANKFEKVPHGLKATATETSNARVGQYIELADKYVNQTVTLSFKVSNVVGDITVYTTTSGTHTYLFSFKADGVYSRTYTVLGNVSMKTGVFLQTEAVTGSTFTIEWAKLELGSFATPFVPRPYGEELVLCQRYYQVRTTNNIAYTDIRPSMRINSEIIDIGNNEYGYDAEIY